MSTTVTLRPLDGQGVALLDELEPARRRRSGRTSAPARPYWMNAHGAPQDGYPAALELLDANWREHLARA
jgi:hypothetical protein